MYFFSYNTHIQLYRVQTELEIYRAKAEFPCFTLHFLPPWRSIKCQTPDMSLRNKFSVTHIQKKAPKT